MTHDLWDQDGDDKVTATIDRESFGLSIGVSGYCDCETEDEHGRILFLEYYQGKLWLRVWNDINQANPISIDMSGALITNRRASPE